MASIVEFNPTGLFDKALFNFDEIINYQNYKLTGVIRVSVSDSYTYLNYAKAGAIATVYTNQASPSPWTTSQVSNFQAIVDVYSQFIGASFAKVTNYSGNSPGTVGLSSDINVSFIYRPTLNFSGMAAIPTAPFGYLGSELDIVLNTAGFSDTSLAITTFGGHALMHEMGHSLGLSHPHSSIVNGTAILTSDFSATINAGFSQLGFVIRSAADLNKEYFTIMSYDDQRPLTGADTFAQTPMIMDVIALQAAYGMGLGTTGLNNDVITPGASGAVDSYRTYFDTGGIDQIVLTNYSTGAYLNMGVAITGAPLKVGVSMSSADRQLMVSGSSPASLRWFYGDFENTQGSAGNDLIIGNGLNNQITGGAGNDTIDGGGGLDVVAFTGTFTSHRITLNTGVATVVDTILNRDGTDALTNVERLKFSDFNVALDISKDQAAGRAYMLYKAAFDRASDEVGLGFWIKALDSGVDLVAGVASNFINTPEFVKLYGNNVSNATFVSNLYNIVLHRTLDQAGSDFWVRALENNVGRPNILVDFATSNENVTQVASLIASGIKYTEFIA